MEAKRLGVNDLLDALQPSVTLVTVSRRLSRELRLAHARRQQARGLRAWETPDILPWGAWLERCWQTGMLQGRDASVPVVLNQHQEQVLWEQVVEASATAHPLLDVAATAHTARRAWDLLHAWALTLSPGDRFVNEDVKAFSHWAQRFRTRCREAYLLDQARLPGMLAAAWSGTGGEGPKRLLLAGFDQLTPAQTTLLSRVEAGGCSVSEIGLAGLDRSTACRVSFADSEDELRGIARWLRRLLEHEEPARIGVVVPDLATRRTQLERIFDEVLTPAAMLPANRVQRAYHLSLGPPLLEWPLVQAAVAALELGRGSMPVGQVGALLKSPFLAAGQREAPHRARLDMRLRALREPKISLASLLEQASAPDGAEWACPLLAARLASVLEEARGWQRRVAASAWAELFSRVLALLGWPGDRSLDSTEHQLLQAWRALLVELASLDSVAGALSHRDALRRVRQLAMSTPFQPGGPEVPVQVLGTLEAGGVHFDHLWVAGLHDEAWPASPSPNPFLPLELQRRHGLPHASAERELAFARTLTRRLAASAHQVVFSHPSRRDDCLLRPSPLIAGLRQETPDRLALADSPQYARQLLAAGGLEPLARGSAPPVTADDPRAGGTAVLRDQSACPFRAFALHRLGAREPEPVSFGLAAADRGALVHAALARLWKKLKSHARLCQCSEEQLAEVVSATAREVVASAAERRPSTFTRRFSELEQWRLSRLLSGWLEVERARQPFFVESCEQGYQAHVGGIFLEARPDRVDRLGDGSLVIMDYKTGRTSPSAWFGERPDEPQLPLYAISVGGPVEAVLFATLRPGDMGLDGVARREAVVPGLPAFPGTRASAGPGSWPALLAEWRAELARLGAGFREGHAEVAPKRYPDTCRYCSLGAFCRVAERNPGTPEEEDG